MNDEKEKLERKDASEETKQANLDCFDQLPFEDQESFRLAHKGFLCPIPGEELRTDGIQVWDPHRFHFIHEKAPAPDTVNPSLWRQSKLTKIGGLFEVVEGIYQVRNYDIANMTIIEGEEGIILVDVLTCAETAKASLDLYYKWKLKTKGKRPPLKALIITHSHLDHFAGLINGVLTEEEAKDPDIEIIVPDEFVDHVYMENLYMGNAMGRRATYMYGRVLPADQKGDVGAGLGSTVANGTITMVPAERLTVIKNAADNTGTHRKTIDGIDFDFLLTPGTEAPAEMHFFVHRYNALCTGENVVHNMHNVYSLRGAQIRDALAWSKDLNTTLNLWGDRAEIYFGVHHWPVWGKENVVNYLKRQRDLYRYINDETLRLANLGYKPVEIAELLRELPPNLEKDWDLRGYYGTLNHNVKSVYVKHIGWFDGNPADLHPYPPCEAGKKYVEFMGGAENVLKKARASFDKGDYRWVVQVVNHLVFADPTNTDARNLQADALEQLGYQSESGPWRNFYLNGAMELRGGVNKKQQKKLAPDQSFILSAPTDIFFDYMGMLLKGWEVRHEKAVFKIHFDRENNTSTIEKKDAGYWLEIENGVINHSRLDAPRISVARRPDLIMSTTRKAFYYLVTGIAGGGITDPAKALKGLIAAGDIHIDEGSPDKLIYILEHLQVLDPYFNIVEPVNPGV
jgi:alkyl sulfatase BDS1-like metallo-beta-lactamase superfamily hydrolase